MENTTWNPAIVDCVSNLIYSRDDSSFCGSIFAELDLPFWFRDDCSSSFGQLY